MISLTCKTDAPNSIVAVVPPIAAPCGGRISQDKQVSWFGLRKQMSINAGIGIGDKQDLRFLVVGKLFEQPLLVVIDFLVKFIKSFDEI
ncbi:MAG TPA: hypothetical protein PKK23_21450 [Nitrospirales bacterium]|nr:hypothetical protein [Nitrospirales bacterium]